MDGIHNRHMCMTYPEELGEPPAVEPDAEVLGVEPERLLRSRDDFLEERGLPPQYVTLHVESSYELSTIYLQCAPHGC